MRIRTLPHSAFTLLAALCCLFTSPKAALAQGAVAFIPTGSNYHYLDNGTDQGTAWRSLSFDDSAWAVGQAPLGYGQANLNTIVSYGNDAANKHITTHFRHPFATPANTSVSNLLVRLRRDDGAIVYLNGQEVFRSNMSTGAVNYLTLAASAVTGADESNYFSSFVFSSTLLAPPGGSNVLAAEVHQASAASSDLAFCSELTGNAALPTSLTIPVPAGFTTLANNFDHGGNTLSELFSQVLDGTEVYKWNPGNQTYSRAIYDANSAGWLDTNANPINFVLSPGDAAWLYSPLAQSLSMTGQVKVVGYVNRPPGGGRHFVSGRQPMSSTFMEITGFAPITGDKVELYDGVFPSIPSQGTSTHVFSNGVWMPFLPLLLPGKGMVVDLVTGGCFDIQCPSNKTVSCDAPWNFNQPVAWDVCCNTNPTYSLLSSNLISSTPCLQIWEGRWQVSSICSNYSTMCTQLVTVVDTIPPQLTWFPDKTNECSAPLTFDRPLAQDLCCSTNSLSWVTNIALISSNQCQIVWLASWQVSDCCGNTSNAWQYVTVVDTTPPLISCPPEQVIPFGAAWDFGSPTAWDSCCPSNSIIIQAVDTKTNSYPCSNVVLRTWSATDCCAKSSTCTQTVTVITCPPAPTLTAVVSAGQLQLGWGPVIGEFSLQRLQGLGGANSWLPVSGLATALSSKTNATNNSIEQIVTADIPTAPIRPPNNFLRLGSNPMVTQDFSVLPTGNFSNSPAGQNQVPWTINAMGAGSLQIADINNTHALLVDDQGIELHLDTNRSAWPNLLTGAPNFHEMRVGVMFATSNAQPMELKAFDVNGQLVSSTQVSNVLFAQVPFWSKGWPFGHFEFKMPGGGTGGLPKVDGVPGIPTIPLAPNCTDLRSYPVGSAPNPWVQPGFTITATNSSNQMEANTYIEAGPEGNGYHVEYSAQIKFSNNTCCRRISEVVIARTSELVEVELTAYAASGTRVLGWKKLTAREGNPATVTFEPPDQPICSIIVKSPTGQTRILKFCCLAVD
jgi:hypothetical protein